MWIIAILLGASWRRWFGSARPGWAKRADGTDRPIGYRATQVVAGLAVLFGLGLLTGEPYWRAALDAGIAIGFMTLPIHISRQPFVFVARWLVARGLPTTERLPHPWRPMLQGAEPWAEAMQGALLWAIAILV